MRSTRTARQAQAAVATPIFTQGFHEPGQDVTVHVQNIVTVRIDVSGPGPDRTMETAMYILGRAHVEEMIAALQGARDAMIRQEKALEAFYAKKDAA